MIEMNSMLKLLFSQKGQSLSRPLTYTYLCRTLFFCPSRTLTKCCIMQRQANKTKIENISSMMVSCSKQGVRLLQHHSKFTTQQILYRAQIVTQKRGYSSSIFVSDRHSETSSSFQFDLEERFSNMEELKINLQRRGLEIDVEQLRSDYQDYVELDQERVNVEVEREHIARQIAGIVSQQKESKTKSKEFVSKMKKLTEEGKNAKIRLKELMVKFWEVEEKVIYAALSLPNLLSHDVPNEQKVLQEYFKDRKPVPPVDHDEVLRKSDMVTLSNVGYKAFYLTGRLAVLEQELISFFSKQLRSNGFTQMLAPEMFKTPVVEAGSVNVVDPASVYRLQCKQGINQVSDWIVDNMFLQGASQFSFLSYFARMMIREEDLPVKMFVVGSNYVPENIETRNLPGLFGVLQSVKFSLCVVSGGIESSVEVMDQLTDMLTRIYKKVGLPFRLVSLSASSLTAAEQNRIEVQIWVPSLQKYLKLGSVSMCGDYNSRRLMIRCSEGKHTYPVYMVHCEVTDITRMLALLLEYECKENTWVR